MTIIIELNNMVSNDVISQHLANLNIDALKASYQNNAKIHFRISLPIHFTGNIPNSFGEINIYLRRDENSHIPFCYRNFIHVHKAISEPLNKCLCLIDIPRKNHDHSDNALAELLRRAEDPTHSNWQRNRLENIGYTSQSKGLITFVKGIAKYLHQILNMPTANRIQIWNGWTVGFGNDPDTNVPPEPRPVTTGTARNNEFNVTRFFDAQINTKGFELKLRNINQIPHDDIPEYERALNNEFLLQVTYGEKFFKPDEIWTPRHNYACDIQNNVFSNATVNNYQDANWSIQGCSISVKKDINGNLLKDRVLFKIDNTALFTIKYTGQKSEIIAKLKIISLA